MAGSTTRTSPTTECRRHDAGNTTGGSERPWRAPTHGSTHVSTGHVAEGGTSIACTMTRGSWRWERHIVPKTHRLMRALQQRQGEAAPTEGAAAEQQEERAAEQTVTAGTGAGMGPHTVGNGATAGVGQPSVEGQGRKRKATTGLRTTSDEEQMANAAAAPSEEWSAEMEQQELETQAKKKKKRLKQTGKRSFRPTQHRRQQATAAAAAAAAEPSEERDGGTR